MFGVLTKVENYAAFKHKHPHSHTHTHTHNFRALENQNQELVTKITEGQGLPWPMQAHLKRLAGYEKTRVMLLQHMEVRLKVRPATGGVCHGNGAPDRTCGKELLYRKCIINIF